MYTLPKTWTKKKPAIEYPEDVIIGAKLRRMKPDDYLRQMSECSVADQRLNEIDRKKLEEMQPEFEPTSDTPLYIPRIKYNPIPVDEDDSR